MPIFEVQTPDGRSFEIEAADQAAAQKVLEIGLGARQREQSAALPVEDVAKSAGTGLLKGAAEIPMLPITIGRLVGTVADLPRRGANLLGANIPEPEQGPVSSALYAGQDAVRGWLDEHLHKPETTAGQFAETIGEFATPAGALGKFDKLGRVVNRTVRYGVVPGAASETAGQVTEGTPYETAARIGTALVTGGAAAITDRPSTAAAALKSRLPKGATEADITAAEKLIADAQQDNIPLTWGQALSQVTNGKVDITDVERVVEQSRGGGGTMRDVQNERPARIAASMGRELDAMTPTPQTPGVMGTRIKGYAEDALTSIRQRINNATQHLINAAGGQKIDPLTFSRLKNDEMFADALQAVRNDPVHKRAIANYPDDSVQVMNEIRMYFDRMAERASSAVQPDNFAARVYGDEARNASRAARRASPEYGDWLDQQAALRQGIQAPAEAGPLGKISRTDNATQQLNAIFERAPLAGSENEVRLAVQAIRDGLPDGQATAASLVRQHLETGFNEATRKLASGQNDWGAAQFAAEIGGNPQQLKNLRAAVLTAFGKDGGVRWAGMQRLFRIMEATGKRRPANSATAQNLRIENEARRGGIIGNIASAVASPRVIRQAYEEWKLGGNMGAMAQIVTDPRSGPLFRSLLAAKSESAAIAAAGRLLMIGAEQSQGRLGVKPEDAFIPRGAGLPEPAGATP